MRLGWIVYRCGSNHNIFAVLKLRAAGEKFQEIGSKNDFLHCRNQEHPYWNLQMHDENPSWNSVLWFLNKLTRVFLTRVFCSKTNWPGKNPGQLGKLTREKNTMMSWYWRFTTQNSRCYFWKFLDDIGTQPWSRWFISLTKCQIAPIRSENHLLTLLRHRDAEISLCLFRIPPGSFG